MRKILLVCASLLMAACGSKGSDNGGGGGGGGKSGTMNDVTDKSTCKGAPVGNPTIFGQDWKSRLSDGNTDIARTVRFTTATVFIEEVCIFPGGPKVRVSISAPANITNDSITILQKREDTKTEPFNGRYFSCSISIEPDTVKYSFVGNCLEVTASGEKNYLVP